MGTMTMTLLFAERLLYLSAKIQPLQPLGQVMLRPPALFPPQPKARRPVPCPL